MTSLKNNQFHDLNITYHTYTYRNMRPHISKNSTRSHKTTGTRQCKNWIAFHEKYSDYHTFCTLMQIYHATFSVEWLLLCYRSNQNVKYINQHPLCMYMAMISTISTCLSSAFIAWCNCLVSLFTYNAFIMPPFDILIIVMTEIDTICSLTTDTDTFYDGENEKIWYILCKYVYIFMHLDIAVLMSKAHPVFSFSTTYNDAKLHMVFQSKWFELITRFAGWSEGN